MKKILIFISLLSFLNLYCPSIGNRLIKLKMNDILQNGDKSKFATLQFLNNFYELNVLHQTDEITCAKHAIRNLIYMVKAFISLSTNRTQQFNRILKQNFNREKFDLFNKLVNYYLAVDPKKGLTGKQINILLSTLILKEQYHPLLKGILPTNLKQIMSSIVPVKITLTTLRSLLITLKEEYKNDDKELINLLDSISGSKELLKSLYDFKKSHRKVLGICLDVPTINPDNSISNNHLISLIIYKSNKNKFEFFILDSYIKKNRNWLPGVKFLELIRKLNK